MCTNPNYCEGECEQCEPYWIRRPKKFVIKKIVSEEEKDRFNKFMKEQLKIVSEMGRKFYKRRENIYEKDTIS